MVLIDESGSTGEPNADLAGGLQILRRELLDAAGPDSGFDTSLTLSAFSGAVRALADRPVESQSEIAAALARIRPEGTTSLYRSMLQVLEPMVRAQERARLDGSNDRFALIVLSDGNDTDSSSPPIARLMELAMSGGVPIYLLVLPSSGTERSFLALGPCSGGDTFLRTADPRRLMQEELLQALLAQVTIEIDADPTIRFHKPRGLNLKAPPGGTLRHPDLVMPERSPQEIAIELAADPAAQRRARLAALQRLAQDASELEVAERLVDLLLEAATRQEPELWRDGVREALALISGRILLWKANDDTQRLALIRLLERARDRGWGGGPRPALLSRVLATFLDPDFPATRALRDRAARL
jgi:hypothetical protein